MTKFGHIALSVLTEKNSKNMKRTLTFAKNAGTSSSELARRETSTMKIILIATFSLALVALTSVVKLDLTATSLLVLGLATIRLTRTISFNTVFEPFRKHLTEIKADSCGAGENVHPRGEGARRVIGELIACPICAGTWSALAMVALWSFAPPVVYVFAVAGASELFHWAFDLLEWSGRAARVVSGAISPDDNVKEMLK